MKKLTKITKFESGQILILVALMMVGILGITVLVIDVGGMNLTRTQLQSAADAAALAGARNLPGNPTLASSAATTYAAANGLSADNVTITIASDNKSITVAINRTSPSLFAKILGSSNSTVSAHSTAQVGIASSVPWIVPFVIAKPAAFNYDNDYVLRMYGAGSILDYPSTTNPGYPNNYKYPYSYTSNSKYAAYGLTNRYPYQFDYMNVYIVSYDSHGDPIFDNYFAGYIDYLKYGYHQTFSITQKMYYYMPSSGGQQSVDAFADRVIRDSNTDYTKAKVGDSRVVLIPVVNSMLKRDTHDKTEITIIGFVGFFVKNVYKSYRSTSPSDYCMDANGNRIYTGYGTCFWIEGRFLKDFVIGTGAVTFDPNANFGLTVVRLTD